MNCPVDPAACTAPHTTISHDEHGNKRWHVRSLTYTTGGLIVLFMTLLMGDFVWSMRDRSIGGMANWYLNSLNISSVLFGIFFSTIPAVITFVLVPVLSVKSDNYRSPRGRRLPFLLFITPLAALGMIGIALTPVIVSAVSGSILNHNAFGGLLISMLSGNVLGDSVLRFLQDKTMLAVALFSVFWLLFEVASISSQPLFTGLINDVVPRPLLGRFFGLFRAVSLIDGMIFNYWILGLVPTYFTAIMLAIGIFYGVAFQIVCYRIHEGHYPEPPPAVKKPGDGVAPPGIRSRITGVKTYFKECFSIPFFIALFLMMMTAGLAFGPVNIFSLPYATSIGLDMNIYGRCIAISYFVSLTLAYFLGWLADKIHPLRMAIITMFGYMVVTGWGSIMATTQSSFIVAFTLHTILSGCYFTGAGTLGQYLFPHSKFAQFASAAGMLGALGGIIVGPAVGHVIDVTGKTYRHTFTIACALAALSLLISIYVYWQFQKLGGTRHYVAPLENETEPEEEEILAETPHSPQKAGTQEAGTITVTRKDTKE